MMYVKDEILGHKATADKPAGVGCTLPEDLQHVQPRHRVFIDGGKIGVIVLLSSNEDYIELEITSPVDGTSKIRPEKGLNFPDSALNVPSITSEDINRDVNSVDGYELALLLLSVSARLSLTGPNPCRYCCYALHCSHAYQNESQSIERALVG